MVRIGLPQFHPNHFETQNQNRLATPQFFIFFYFGRSVADIDI